MRSRGSAVMGTLRSHDASGSSSSLVQLRWWGGVGGKG